MDQWYGSHLPAGSIFFFSTLINDKLRQILTHSHSRVVMKALLHAHKRKRISVYVTEGVKPGFFFFHCDLSDRARL